MRLENGSKKINILGSPWNITVDAECSKHTAGYTDTCKREIYISSKIKDDDYRSRVIRHEVIHAYLTESGLDGNGLKAESWEHNEEMVDWFAIQLPKIINTFMELGVL